MVAISLQTNTPEQKKQARQIVEDLRNNYGVNNVTVNFRFEYWVYIDISHVNGWVQGNVASFDRLGYDQKAKLHLFDNETQRINYDIPFEIIDTIYRL